MTITIQCPSCGKKTSSDRLNQAVTLEENCTRCTCNLSALFQLKASAMTAQRQAMHALRENRFSDSLQHCELSWQHCSTRGTADLGFTAAVLQSDPALAIKWQCRRDQYPD